MSSGGPHPIARFRARIEAARKASPCVGAPSDEDFRAAVIEARKEYHDKLRAGLIPKPGCECGGFDRNGSHDAGEYVGYCDPRNHKAIT